MAKKKGLASSALVVRKEQGAAPEEKVSGLFSIQKATAIDETKLERLNSPRLLKPGQVPIWTVEQPTILIGEVIRIIPSQNSQIKGFCLWLKLATGFEITFPVTGVIRSALAPGIKIDDKSKESLKETSAALKEALDKHIGKTIYIRRTGDTLNKQYNREQFMFDVWTSKA